MTHAELVERAVRWLRNSQGCHAVIHELVTSAGEIADALGWKSHGCSILIECKTSRADFYADRKKPSRTIPELSIGTERYYLTPPGLLHPEDLPEGWGLLEVRGKTIRTVIKAVENGHLADDGVRREIQILLSLIRRVEIRIGPMTLREFLSYENRDLRFQPPESAKAVLP